MKLNLGCGNTLKEGYINIDLIDLVNPPHNYIKMDVFDIDRRFPQCFTEVYSEYLMEHLSVMEIRFLLYKIYKVLLPNGVYRFIVPNILKIIKYFTKVGIYSDSSGLELFNFEVFGSTITRETLHKSVWTKKIAYMHLEDEELFIIKSIDSKNVDDRNVSMEIMAQKK
jgi:hypothetical protein